jgi:hypothetical protein
MSNMINLDGRFLFIDAIIDAIDDAITARLEGVVAGELS